MPIRVRLTVVFVVAMTVVLAVIGSFLFFRTKQSIDDAIAQSLRARQGAASAYVASQRGGVLALPPGERFAQVLTSGGAVLVTRPEAAAPMLGVAQARTAASGLHGFELHEQVRYLAGPVTVRGRRVVVVAAASLADHERALEGLSGALLIGGPLALLLAAAAAYFVAGSALRPVEEMRLRAETIETADPVAQLPEPAVDDELRRLSVTLNAMLRRIAAASEHERRFVANASHELRTPLAALQTELELAERHGRSSEELKAASGRGREDVARLVGLTNDLLELARVSEARTVTRASIDVADLLATAASDLERRAAEAGRELVVEPVDLEITGDPQALRRATGNLIENALVHGAGRITVGAAATDDGRAVELSVRDDGTLHPSIAAGIAFERFGRGADAAARPGAGLGLALVAAIAEQHGGSAELLELPGTGVCAVLRLPALPSA
jgi:two-component system OmpR family sensor kinase